MIFKKLFLKNFKSYQNAEITFNKGITIIVGENGAGKSTILEGISFALFKQHGAKKIGELVRNNSSEPMVVELEFIVNGKDYKIVRERSGEKLVSKLFKKSIDIGEFMPLAVGDKEVSSQLSKILAIDSDLFLNAIYVRQGEIAELVNKSPAEKKLLIGKLLGLDSLENAWKNIQPIISHYENKKAELKGKLSMSGNLEEEHNKKVAELKNLKDQGHGLEEKLKGIRKIQEENHTAKLNIEREKEIYEKFVSNLNAEENALKILLNDKNQIQESLSKIDEAGEKLTILQSQIKKLPLYLEFENAVKNIEQLRDKEEELESKIDSINTQEEILKNSEKGKNKYNEAEEDIKNLNEKKNGIEKELIGLGNLEEDKSNLIEESEKISNELKDFINNSKKQLTEFGLEKDKINEIDTDLSKLDEVVDEFLENIEAELKKINEEIIDKNERLAKLDESINTCERPLTELNEVEGICPVCQSRITDIQKESLIVRYQSQIEENKKLIEENKKDIKYLNMGKKNLENKEKEAEKLSKDIIEYNYKYSDLEKNMKEIQEIDNSIESKTLINNKLSKIINKITEAEQESKEYKQNYEDYIKAQGILDVLGDVDEIKEELNILINELDENIQRIKEITEQDSNITTKITTEELSKQINDLKEKDAEYNQLKGFIQTKESLEAQLDAKQKDIVWKQDSITTIRENIENSDYDKVQYEKLLSEYEIYDNKEKEYNEDLIRIKTTSKALISEVQNLKDKILLNNAVEKKYHSTDEYLTILNKIRDLYSKNGIQKELRSYSRPLIQKYTKEFFNKFNFDYSDLILDDEYNVTVYGPEGESSLNMVSGGEKIAIALALRLGITQSLSEGNLETILLDEPTVHLDSSRRQDLINLLKEINLLPQMIIVTHEDYLKNAADNLINVEKRNGLSNVQIQ